MQLPDGWYRENDLLAELGAGHWLNVTEGQLLFEVCLGLLYHQAKFHNSPFPEAVQLLAGQLRAQSHSHTGNEQQLRYNREQQCLRLWLHR